MTALPLSSTAPQHSASKTDAHKTEKPHSGSQPAKPK